LGKEWIRKRIGKEKSSVETLTLDLKERQEKRENGGGEKP
jgi:hypothetical protein